jgi:alpha-D-xyloside xylohydrolase
VTVAAPLAKLPLFLRAGGIVPLLDPTIDTLAPATDPDVVTPEDVADRLDVMVALGPGDAASFRLADGTELSAARVDTDAGHAGLLEVDPSELPDCASCFQAAPEDGVRRLRVNGELAKQHAIAVEDVELRQSGGPARRIRWDVLLLDP